MTDALLLPTTVVGSYVQPDWLVDRKNLKSRLPPRVRASELWRVAPEYLEEAQDAATLAAIRDMELAGVDIVTDGEIRRESYSNRFATALSGIDIVTPGTALDRTGHPNPVPRISGPIRRNGPVEVRDAEFLVRNTSKRTKITLPGPFTMLQQAQNDHYPSAEAAAMDYAAAVNEELRALFAAGVSMVQLDEPYLQARPDEAKKYAVKALNRALEGITGETVVHLCFGYAHIVHERPNGYSFLPELANVNASAISIEAAQPSLDLSILRELPNKKIMLGVISLGDPAVETPEIVADRIRRALTVIPKERIIVAPDCGMKYLSRDVAFGKLSAMVRGTEIVRRELQGAPVPLTGIAHTGIRVHDMERSTRFYELLGFTRTAGPLGPEPVAILEHPSGIELNLILNARSADAPNVLMDVPEKHPGITHIALLCPDILAAKARLETAGITLSGGPIRFTPTSQGVFVRDPDRNVIELHQRG